MDVDLIIAGGGLVGLSLAHAVAAAGLQVAVIDPVPPEAATEAVFDGRVSALGRASYRMFDALGLTGDMASEAQPILDILVSDGVPAAGGYRGPSPLTLHFGHTDAGAGPLGHIVENRVIRVAQNRAVAQQGNMTLIAPDRVLDAEPDSDGVTVQLASGDKLRARLCVAADGRDSALRTAAKIKTVRWAYGQTGIVTTVHHDRPHAGVAHEYFLPAGPFAILPMTGNRASLVWTEPTARANAIMQLDQAVFDAELSQRFGSHWGAVCSHGPRWSYPLAFHLARDYIAPRLALIGDAAHGIHPIAGQGLNLGLRDAAALAEVIVDAHRLGLDIGAPTTLAGYAQWRRFDNMSLAVTTDLLNRLFSNDLPPLRLARNLGMALVDRIAPMRNLFLRHAAGEVGTLPRLLRGQSL